MLSSVEDSSIEILRQQIDLEIAVAQMLTLAPMRRPRQERQTACLWNDLP